ncbi:MAG: hypothetical protein HKN33_10160 [Pyrinomonadaceae bacterium]|nr:hypothetical protein [Pyrinomonadaceae bacterium]
MPFEQPFEESPAISVEEGPENGNEVAFDPSSMPVRLLPISSEDLEHVEDKKLDAAFENHLLRIGDDLLPIQGSKELMDEFFAETELTEDPDVKETCAPVSDNKAVEIARGLSVDDDEPIEMPVLPDNPTEKDLLEFAQNHPSVRSLLKLFRGRVINVRKRK